MNIITFDGTCKTCLKLRYSHTPVFGQAVCSETGRKIPDTSLKCSKDVNLPALESIRGNNLLNPSNFTSENPSTNCAACSEG